jgi:hypothetical protein
MWNGNFEWNFFLRRRLDAYLIQNVGEFQKKKKEMICTLFLRQGTNLVGRVCSIIFLRDLLLYFAGRKFFKSLSLCGRRIQFPFPLAHPSLMIWYKLASFGEILAT